MKDKKLTEMTDEELLKREKSAKVITYMFLGAVIVLAVLAVINTVKNGFTAISVMPVGFFPLLMVSFVSLANLKKLKKERGL